MPLMCMLDSCHLPHVIKNIPVRKLIWLKRNCSDALMYPKVEAEALSILRACKYPDWSPDRTSSIVSEISRSRLINNNRPQVTYDQEETTRAIRIAKFYNQ